MNMNESKVESNETNKSDSISRSERKNYLFCHEIINNRSIFSFNQINQYNNSVEKNDLVDNKNDLENENTKEVEN